MSAADATTAASDAALDVSEQDFERLVLERSKELPVVVDFWAPWCGPCGALGPVLEREVAARAGRVALAKVDVDQAPQLLQEHDIRSIPAVKAYKDGRVVSEFVGALPPARVQAFLDELLAPTPYERLLAELEETGAEPDLLAALQMGYRDQALGQILERVRQGGPEERERLRRYAVAVFDDLGPEHPATVRYRRELASLLF